MYTGTECKGKSYKFSENTVIGHADPKAVYESDREVRKRWFTVRDKATVFDMGAEYGHWTLAAITQGANMVYSVEMDPEYIKAFKFNLYENGYAEHCMPIRLGINQYLNIDVFIDALSYPPESIQFIRLGETYTETKMVQQILQGARTTIAKYKPQLIASFDQSDTYTDFHNVVADLNRPFSHQLLDVMYRKYVKIMFA